MRASMVRMRSTPLTTVCTQTARTWWKKNDRWMWAPTAGCPVLTVCLGSPPICFWRAMRWCRWSTAIPAHCCQDFGIRAVPSPGRNGMSSRLAWPMTRPIAWNSSIWEVRPGIRSVSLPGRSWRGPGMRRRPCPGSLGGGRQSTPGSRRRSISETHFNPISRNAWPRAGWMPCSRGRMPPISFMRRSCISGMMCPAGRAMTPIL